jgi:hypothetical protein
VPIGRWLVDHAGGCPVEADVVLAGPFYCGTITIKLRDRIAAEPCRLIILLRNLLER